MEFDQKNTKTHVQIKYDTHVSQPVHLPNLRSYFLVRMPDEIPLPHPVSSTVKLFTHTEKNSWPKIEESVIIY